MATIQDQAVAARANYYKKAVRLGEDFPQLSQVVGAKDADSISHYLDTNKQLDPTIKNRLTDLLTSLRTAEQTETQAQQQAQQAAIEAAEANTKEATGSAGIGVAAGGAAAAAQGISSLRPPATMEADRRYQKVLQDLKDAHEKEKQTAVNQWVQQQEAQRQKDIDDAIARNDWQTARKLRAQETKVSEETLHNLGYGREAELNFLYGSTDGSTPSVHDDARKLFLEQEFDTKTGKYSKRAQRYLDKEQKLPLIGRFLPGTDPLVAQMKQRAEDHISARVMTRVTKDTNPDEYKRILQEERAKIYDAERKRLATRSSKRGNRYSKYLDKYFQKKLAQSKWKDARKLVLSRLGNFFLPRFGLAAKFKGLLSRFPGFSKFLTGLKNFLPKNPLKGLGSKLLNRLKKFLPNPLKALKNQLLKRITSAVGQKLIMFIFANFGAIMFVILVLVFVFMFFEGGGGVSIPGSGSGTTGNCVNTFSDIGSLTDALSTNYNYDLDTTELTTDQELPQATTVWNVMCLLNRNVIFKETFDQGFPPQSGNSLIKIISSGSDLITDDEKANIKKANSGCGYFIYDYQDYNLGNVITGVVSNNLQSNHQMQLTYFDFDKCKSGFQQERYVIINSFSLIYTNTYFSDHVGGASARDDFRKFLQTSPSLLGTPNCSGAVPTTISDTLLYGCFSDMLTQYFLTLN